MKHCFCFHDTLIEWNVLQLSKNYLLLFLLWMNWPLSLDAQSLPFHFDAKAIITLSDADMAASAYIDGKLKAEDKVSDALTIVQWSDLSTNIQTQSLNVPNSVTNWVDGLDVSIDNQVVFVVDTKGGLPRSIEHVENVQEDLPKGNTLYAIDISNKDHPQLLDRIQVGQHLLSVDVNPMTGHLLLVNRESGKEVIVVEWNKNSFGKMTTKGLAIANHAATHGNWHPSGKYFGLTIEPAMEIRFYHLMGSEIQQIGKPIPVGSYPGAGQFSKNGDFYILPDLKWDQGYDVKGSLCAVRFSNQGDHVLSSQIPVDISPEAFAISPRGDLIAVSNMGTNFMPIDFPLFGKKASITLLAFDETTGQFETLDNQAWEGILPEGITFDADGDMIVVTSYDYLDLTARKGGLAFWEVYTEEGNPKLKNTGFKLTLTRGSHYVRIID